MQAHINVLAQEEGKDLYEAVLTLQLTAKVDSKLLWRFQLLQAGLYTIKDFSKEQCPTILNGYCMNQLYPYASSIVSAAAVQGGFPPVYLGPMNFELLYQERQQESKKPLQ